MSAGPGGEDPPRAPVTGVPVLDGATAALDALDDAFTREAWLSLGG
jgi:hypothetical protein